jgi:predicted dehydrogenase
MAKPVRLGVVGAGSIGIRAPLAHFSKGDLKDRVVLQAVCDPVPGRARAAADKFGVARWFERYEDLLEKGECDAVTICSPIGLHFKQGMQAVKAGVHLHFNKTMTTTRDEADKLIAAAKKAKVRIVASPGMMLRPDILRIRKLIEDGAIGKICWSVCGGSFGNYHETEGVRQGTDVLSNIDPTWYFRKPGGGPLYDITVYPLTTLVVEMGPAKRVTAMSGVAVKEREFKGRMVKCDADDNTLITVDFGNNAFSFVHGTPFGGLADFGMVNYYGTRGEIKGRNLNGKPFDYPGAEEAGSSGGIVLTEHVRGNQHSKMGEMHVFEDVMQLVDWVREGKPSPANADVARHVIEIFDAAYKSAKTGKTQVLESTFTPVKGV